MELGHSRRASSLPWSVGALEGNFIAATLSELSFLSIDGLKATKISRWRICSGQQQRDLARAFYTAQPREWRLRA
jgi:hypothetical protein